MLTSNQVFRSSSRGHHLCCFAVVLATLAGCGPTNTVHSSGSGGDGAGGNGTGTSTTQPTTGGGGPGGGGTAGNTGGTTSGGGGTGTTSGTGGAAPIIPACQQTCASPADCSSPNAPPILDQSHYACDAGLCKYTGCKNNNECMAAYGSNYGCTQIAGSNLKSCLMTCASPADCATPNSPPILDQSHYTCDGGFCKYNGCKSNSDCMVAYGSNYACAQIDGSTVKACYMTCASPADCATPNAPPLLDQDHYACDAGLCKYTGCKSSSECMAAYGQAYTCN